MERTVGAAGRDELRAAKELLREQTRARRRERGPQERDRVARELSRHGLLACAGAGTVAAYASFGTEPGTEPLRLALHAAGVRVLLPVVRGADLAWVPDPGTPLTAGGERGLPEPEGPVVGTGAAGLVAAGVSVVLVPALVVDEAGVRLGKGAGFYDRVLAFLPAGAARTLAVVHDDELLPAGEVPAEDHDRAARVDGALTPGGPR